MYKTLTVFSLLFFVMIPFVDAKDVIRLADGNKIKCRILEIEPGKLTYMLGKNIRTITSEQVLQIEIDGRNEKIKSKILALASPVDPLAMCEFGKADANLYHNRGFGNFCLGFFLGPFGVLGTAIGTPRSPDYVKIQNKENLSDPTYLNCYKKRAKGKNVTNALVGWGAIIVLAYVINN